MTVPYSPRLIVRLRKGEPLAWEGLYGFVRVSVVPCLGLPRHLDPEKIVGDTVVEVWKSLRTLRKDCKFAKFVSVIARRGARRKERESHRVSRESSAREPGRSGGQTKSLEAEELLERIIRALSESQRRLFRLRYVLGASSSEIQMALGVSRSALWRKNYLLRKKLREVLTYGR